ncbi:MAG TPA: membrane protein insertase YidC [Thermoanaerobaculia bacterium]
MDNRRLLIAVLVSMAIWLAWTVLFPEKPAAKRPVPPGGAPAATATEATAPAQAPEIPEQAAAPAPGPASPSTNVQPPPAIPIAAEIEERVVLEDDQQRATFTNRGGQLVSLVLKHRMDADGKPLELVRRRASPPYPYALVDRNLAPLPLESSLFAVEGRASDAVSFRYSGPNGTATKRFHFDPKGLLVAEIEVPGRRDWGLEIGPGVRNPSLAQIESPYLPRDAVFAFGGEIKRFELKKAEPRTFSGATLGWAGLEDNYYLAAIIPAQPVARALLAPVLVDLGPSGVAARFVPVPRGGEVAPQYEAWSREFLVVLQPDAESLATTAFWGAKEYDRLAGLPYGLERTLSLGYFGFLARPLLTGLHWIYDHVVHNYGWGIILMTLLIKIVTLPLTHRSYVSMRKMQELNPRMQAIRDRYKSKMRDKQGKPNLESQRKMNEEIMGLYKAEGVNPAGGCLPLIVQLPILWAFYSMLRAAVDLQNAPWILWIHDLSSLDPYYVLPIVMTGTQFIQQRMTPMAGDPMQRRMFQLMPLFMFLFFFKQPSGLVLYWLTNNVLTIIQQGVYNHIKSRQA